MTTPVGPRPGAPARGAGPRPALAALAWLTALAALCASGCGGGDLPALAAGSAPRLRVLVGETGRGDDVLRIVGQAWEVCSEGGRPFQRRGRTEVNAPVAAGAQGISVGGEDTGATVLRIRAERDVEIEGRRYAGDLVLRLEAGRVRFVNEVDLETYVAGVIGNEMVRGAPGAAYRAQAVAARTYGWMRLVDPGASDRPWHLTDDQSSQVYSGLVPRYPDVAYAEMAQHARHTAGVILAWANRPFPAYYASTCGGHTTDARTSLLDPLHADLALRGVACGFCASSPRFEWTKEVTEEEVVAGLKARGRPVVAPIHALEVSRRGAGGWAAEVSVTYGPERKVRRLPGPDFRSALRLDSHNLHRLERTRGGFRIVGRGWGHGVGMCQWGAMEMARRGATESEILSWYYPGAAFVRVY